MTDRIDELQRLHEASNMGRWSLESGDPDLQRDIAAFCAMMNSWPAIHRVLVAAREVAGNAADDIDSRLRYVEVRPHRDEWKELVEALRVLDGGA